MDAELKNKIIAEMDKYIEAWSIYKKDLYKNRILGMIIAENIVEKHFESNNNKED